VGKTLNSREKILITNIVKEEFIEIDFQYRSGLYLIVKRDTQSSGNNTSGLGEDIFLDFWFQRYITAHLDAS
jgi:hypothetical protein